MFILTGDTHRDFSKIELFWQSHNYLSNDLTITVLGDAGINYYSDKQDIILKEQLSKLPISLFFIHGNHELRPANISTYKEVEMFGSSVYREEKYKNLIFAKDGEVYLIENKKILVIGGAYSADKYTRLARGEKWFADEQPSQTVKKQTEENLKRFNWDIDYVLSHTCPIQYEPIDTYTLKIDQSKVDKSTEIWLSEIEKTLSYKKWFCGHFHIDREVDKILFLYEKFVNLDC